MDTIYSRISDFVLHKPALILFLTALVVIGSAFGLVPLINDYSLDYRVLFSEKNPQYRAFLDMEDTYGKRDNIMIVMEPDNGDVFTKKNLTLIKKITDKAWQTPYSVRADSLTNFQRSYSRGDELIVEDLVPEIDKLSQQDLEQIRQYASSEPMLVNRMISKKSHVTAVNIMMNLPSDAGPEQFEAVDYVKALMEEIREEAPWMTLYKTDASIM